MALITTRPAFLLPGDNLFSGATITPLEEATGYDADEMLVPSYASSWRSTSLAASRYFDVDLGSQQTIDVIALFGTNLTDAAEFRIYGEVSDNTFAAPRDEDSGLLDVFDLDYGEYESDDPPWGRPLIYIPSPSWSVRYVRVILTDTANPDGYLEAAFGFAGVARQPGPFHDWTPGERVAGPRGRSVSELTHQMTWRNLDETARRGLLSITRALRRTGRFGFIPRPDDKATWTYEAILGRLSGAIEQAPMPLAAASGIETRWSVTAAIEEVTD